MPAFLLLDQPLRGIWGGVVIAVLAIAFAITEIRRRRNKK